MPAYGRQSGSDLSLDHIHAPVAKTWPNLTANWPENVKEMKLGSIICAAYLWSEHARYGD
jgi:hypothetical protein